RWARRRPSSCECDRCRWGSWRDLPGGEGRIVTRSPPRHHRRWSMAPWTFVDATRDGPPPTVCRRRASSQPAAASPRQAGLPEDVAADDGIDRVLRVDRQTDRRATAERLVVAVAGDRVANDPIGVGANVDPGLVALLAEAVRVVELRVADHVALDAGRDRERRRPVVDLDLVDRDPHIGPGDHVVDEHGSVRIGLVVARPADDEDTGRWGE